MTSHEQIEIPISHTRTGIIFAVTAACLIFFGLILYIRPGETGANSMVAGGVGEFAVCFAMGVFAIYIIFLSKSLIDYKSIISVGDKGIFDRRVSTAWIPWSAVRAVSIVDRNSQKNLLFKISQSNDVAKTLRKRMISFVGFGAPGAPHEFLVEAGKLKGGFTALHNTVTKFYEIPHDGRAH